MQMFRILRSSVARPLASALASAFLSRLRMNFTDLTGHRPVKHEATVRQLASTLLDSSSNPPTFTSMVSSPPGHAHGNLACYDFSTMVHSPWVVPKAEAWGVRPTPPLKRRKGMHCFRSWTFSRYE